MSQLLLLHVAVIVGVLSAGVTLLGYFSGRADRRWDRAEVDRRLAEIVDERLARDRELVPTIACHSPLHEVLTDDKYGTRNARAVGRMHIL